jgi:hypothetical protein
VIGEALPTDRIYPPAAHFIAAEHCGLRSSPYHQTLARRRFENLMIVAAHEVIPGFLLLVEHLPPVIVEYNDPAGRHVLEETLEHSDPGARRFESRSIRRIPNAEDRFVPASLC